MPSPEQQAQMSDLARTPVVLHPPSRLASPVPPPVFETPSPPPPRAPITLEHTEEPLEPLFGQELPEQTGPAITPQQPPQPMAPQSPLEEAFEVDLPFGEPDDLGFGQAALPAVSAFLFAEGQGPSSGSVRQGLERLANAR